MTDTSGDWLRLTDLGDGSELEIGRVISKDDYLNENIKRVSPWDTPLTDGY